jgi:hypothetical protein
VFRNESGLRADQTEFDHILRPVDTVQDCQIDLPADAIAIFLMDQGDVIVQAARERLPRPIVNIVDEIRPFDAVPRDIPVPDTDLPGLKGQLQALFVSLLAHMLGFTHGFAEFGFDPLSPAGFG